MPIEGQDKRPRSWRALIALLAVVVASGRAPADEPRTARLSAPSAFTPEEHTAYQFQPFPPPEVGPPPGAIQGLPVYPAFPPSAEHATPACVPPCPPSGDQQPCGPFEFLTRGGGRFSGFPKGGLLWDPLLAAKREPRTQVLFSSLDNATSKSTVDTSIGLVEGLLRYTPPSGRFAIQLDGFAVVASRFAQWNYLVASDYRAGLPVTFACGPWSGKLGYEHTSSHLGDDEIVLTGRQPFEYSRDELVGAIARRFLSDRLRVYGQAAWSFDQTVPGNPSPFRFDIGAEGFWRFATGCWGAPFAALNVEFDGAVNYSAAVTVQLGWHWRDPSRRLSQARVFGEYYSGRSPYGQFFQTREQFFGFGISFDY